MDKDVEIEIYNKTDRNWRFVILQQDENIGEMFKEIFPVAWMVLYLSGNTNTNNENSEKDLGTGKLTYPNAIQIGVKEKNVESLSKKKREVPGKSAPAVNLNRWEPAVEGYERFTVTKENVSKGQYWGFSIENKFPKFTLISTGASKSISCVNKAVDGVDISICKNRLPFITELNVEKYNTAEFYNKSDYEGEYPLSPKLWVIYSQDLEQGSIIPGFVEAPQSKEIDLMGISKAVLTLSGSGNNLEWKLKTM